MQLEVIFFKDIICRAEKDMQDHKVAQKNGPNDIYF
jgi:hypothetical protein